MPMFSQEKHDFRSRGPCASVSSAPYTSWCSLRIASSPAEKRLRRQRNVSVGRLWPELHVRAENALWLRRSRVVSYSKIVNCGVRLVYACTVTYTFTDLIQIQRASVNCHDEQVPRQQEKYEGSGLKNEASKNVH